MQTAWGGRIISYLVDFGARKHLYITVSRNGDVVVRAPRSCRLERVIRSVERKRPWIARHLERFEGLPPDDTPTFESGENHLYLGSSYPLRVERGGRRGVALESSHLLVAVGPGAGPRAVRLALRRWYSRQARPEFEQRLARLQREVPLFAPLRFDVRLRHMTRRWGSCSSRRVITMNPLLVQAPSECIDYVLAHELVHLLEFGHTPRFYQLLGRVMPDWKEREALLKKNAGSPGLSSCTRRSSAVLLYGLVHAGTRTLRIPRLRVRCPWLYCAELRSSDRQRGAAGRGLAVRTYERYCEHQMT